MSAPTHYAPPNMNAVVGECDVVFLVLDSLRYDVAVDQFAVGNTPHFAQLFPNGWERRHTPGTFTLAAHQAFFAGFLPTPADPQADKTRLFACRFEGSETAGANTWIGDEDTWIRALTRIGYRSMCIGGVGFFNGRTPLSRHLPSYFTESIWAPELGVTSQHSTEKQFRAGAEWLSTVAQSEAALLFINVSALHQPNHMYARAAGPDDLSSHAAALRYVDSQLPILREALRVRGRQTFVIATSDHGTAYGEEGWTGHRLAHEVTWTVPYAHCLLP